MKLHDILVDALENSPSLDTVREKFKKWTIKFRNSLPNSSFAVIEPAYLKGETLDKRARHLPFRDQTGKIDKSHLQNALARVNQIKPLTDSITVVELRRQAGLKLATAKKEVGWD